jgi:hypothetical protein
LLANIYLHLLDRNFRRHVDRGALHGRLVRYADDFVVLCSCPPDREKEWAARLMERLGLTLRHPDKTRVVDVGKDWVNFLGHRIRRRPSGRVALDIAPKAMSRIRDTLRDTTRWTFLSQAELIAELNGEDRVQVQAATLRPGLIGPDHPEPFARAQKRIVDVGAVLDTEDRPLRVHAPHSPRAMRRQKTGHAHRLVIGMIDQPVVALDRRRAPIGGFSHANKRPRAQACCASVIMSPSHLLRNHGFK